MGAGPQAERWPTHHPGGTGKVLPTHVTSSAPAVTGPSLSPRPGGDQGLLCSAPGKSAARHVSRAATMRQAAPQNGGPLGSGPSGSRTPTQAPSHGCGVRGPPPGPRVGAARPRGAVSPGGEGSGQAQRGPSAAAGLPWGRQGQGGAELLGGWRVPPNAERGPPPLYSGEAGAQGRARGRGSHGESAMGASGLLLSCPTQVTKCKGHRGQHASRTSLRPPNGSTRTHSRFLSGGDPKEQRGPSPHADGRPRRRTTGRPLTAGADGDRGSARPVGTEASSPPGPRCSVVRERASSRRSGPAPPPTESEPPGGPRGSPGCTPESENRRWRAVS